jgi:DNA-binding response OmpR family regulator
MANLGRKILVIEDDLFLRRIINKKLLKEGYSVIEAIDGEKGLKAVKEEKPDLVLLDLVLPEMDGFEILDKIKKDPAVSKIPVIVLSNLGEKNDIERGLKTGAADYLVKAHFTPGEIIDKIESVLKIKR